MLQGYADEVSMPVSKSLKSSKLSILPLMSDVNFTESEKALCSSLQLFFNMVHSYEKNGVYCISRQESVSGSCPVWVNTSLLVSGYKLVQRRGAANIGRPEHDIR